MPLCDSSEASVRAVRLSPSPADLLPGLTAGASEVSRFSCMKSIGVSRVFDYAGPSSDSRYRPCSCCQPRILKRLAPPGRKFSQLDTHPTYPLSTPHCVPRGSSARLEAKWIATPFL